MAMGEAEVEADLGGGVDSGILECGGRQRPGVQWITISAAD
jgi:hypothetical protein